RGGHQHARLVPFQTDRGGRTRRGPGLFLRHRAPASLPGTLRSCGHSSAARAVRAAHSPYVIPCVIPCRGDTDVPYPVDPAVDVLGHGDDGLRRLFVWGRLVATPSVADQAAGG